MCAFNYIMYFRVFIEENNTNNYKVITYNIYLIIHVISICQVISFLIRFGVFTILTKEKNGGHSWWLV